MVGISRYRRENSQGKKLERKLKETPGTGQKSSQFKYSKTDNFVIIFYYRIMGNPHLQLELQSLIKAFINASQLMYEFYEEEMKVIFLLLLAFISFKVGKKTVTDPLEMQIKSTKKILETRQQFTQVLPERIKSIGVKIVILIVLGLVGVGGYFGAQQYRPDLLKGIDLKIVIFVGGAVLAAIVLLWFYQLVLKFQLSRGKYNDHHVMERLSTIVKMLGGKTELLLKYALCKDELLKIKQAPIGVCTREKCREHRELLKEKTSTISAMIDNVLNFQWCSVCKRRPLFDEFVDYRTKAYAKKEDQAEEAQVMDRNSYLLDEVEKMAKWAKEVGPCNCSMRYWNESKKEILQFKKREKEIDQRIAMFQARKSLKR